MLAAHVRNIYVGVVSFQPRSAQYDIVSGHRHDIQDNRLVVLLEDQLQWHCLTVYVGE